MLRRLGIQRDELHQQFELKTNNLEKKLYAVIMRCALGSEPVESALKVLYALPASTCIAAVDRKRAAGKSIAVLGWCDGQIALKIHELNHNVAVEFDRTSDFTSRHGEHVRCRLLHPYDTARSRELSIELSQPNASDLLVYPNFITSKELDKYTVNGKYYVA